MPVYLFVSGHSAPHMPSSRPPASHLSDSEFIEELCSLGGTPEELLQDSEFLQLMIPLLRADFTLCDAYKYDHEKTLNCPISAFGGLQDPEVPHDGISAWRVQTSGCFRLHFFEGDHFFIQKEQAALLQALSQDLLSVL
jgi:surfactin synthase thioesterase subunit